MHSLSNRIHKTNLNKIINMAKRVKYTYLSYMFKLMNKYIIISTVIYWLVH